MTISAETLARWVEQNPDLTVVNKWGGEPTDSAQQEFNQARKQYLELAFETYARQLGFEGEWLRNYRFAYLENPSLPRYELDFALPGFKIGIEINGGQGASKSGHSNWQGLERDALKQNLAARLGWTLFWFTTSMLRKDTWQENLQPVLDWIASKVSYLPDWANIDKEYNWVAVDATGAVYAYQTKPIHGWIDIQEMWVCDPKGTFYRRIGDITITRDRDWREMLYERPKTLGQPVPDEEIPF